MQHVGERDAHLRGRERAIAGAEQRERHERDRRDRRHAVDAHRDLEGELLQLEVLLVGVRRRVRIRAAQGLRQRERLAEADVDVPVAAAQPAHHAQEPAEALARLRAAALLGGVVAHVGDLVVGDRDRDQEDVLALGAPVGVDHVGEQSEARRQQLAGARAAALDVPLEREALLDQVVDVVVQHELVDLVVAEAAADEEGAAAPHQRPDREEVHVDAAGRVVGRVAVLVQRVLEHQMVEVRLVRGEEHHGVLLRERLHVLELVAIVVELPPVALRVEQADQPGDQVDHERAVGGGDLAQVPRGLARHARGRAPERARQAVDAAAERRPAEDVLVDQARHLVARAAQRALGALEREHRLARDELGEPRGLGEIGAAGAAPALAQLGDGRRLARDDAAAIGLAAQDQPLVQRSGIARIAQQDQIARQHACAASSRLLGSQATRSGASSASPPDARQASSARSERRLRGRRDGGRRTTS